MKSGNHRVAFFIAGAPRCGTTALFDYLVGHPAVFMPSCKEANYFCSDLRTFEPRRTAPQYLQLFATAPGNALWGEASSLYLYSNVAAAAIARYNPAAKIIVIVRNPIDAARSFHASAYAYGHENVADFEQAWRLQAPRLAGQHLPQNWPDPKTLQFGAIYRYAAQIRRLFEHIPRRQCLFLRYETFFEKPIDGYARLTEFLGLANISPPNGFRVVNATPRGNAVYLQRMLSRVPKQTWRALRPLSALFHSVGWHPLRTTQTLLSMPGKPTELRPAFRQELEDYFRADTLELEAILLRPTYGTSVSA